MTDSLDMAKIDKRYGSDDYLPIVFYNGEGFVIGFKTEQGYEEPFWIYDGRSGLLIETEGDSGVFEELERIAASPASDAAPAPIAEITPFYGARKLEDGLIGILSADGTEVSSLWYGVYDEENDQLVKTRLFPF